MSFLHSRPSFWPLPLPLPLFVEKKARFPIPPAEASENTSISVAFASFELDGAQFEDPHTIEPEIVHDLKVEARISRWPEGADRLVLEPLSVEPAGTYELPTFTLDRPTGGSAPVLSATGRLLIRNPLSMFARPPKFKYRARFEPFRSDMSVFIQGQRALRVQCFDPVRTPQSGYAQIDQRLVALRDQARHQPAIKDRELHNFLLLMTALGAINSGKCDEQAFPAVVMLIPSSAANGAFAERADGVTVVVKFGALGEAPGGWSNPRSSATSRKMSRYTRRSSWPKNSGNGSSLPLTRVRRVLFSGWPSLGFRR